MRRHKVLLLVGVLAVAPVTPAEEARTLVDKWLREFCNANPVNYPAEKYEDKQRICVPLYPELFYQQGRGGS